MDSGLTTVRYTIGDGLQSGPGLVPYQPNGNAPVKRPLHIYALDPGAAALDGATTIADVPYETLKPGPEGAAFHVVDVDATGRLYEPVNLDEPALLLTNGLKPSPVSPQFRQQMVYAVCCRVRQSFRKALGRQLDWGFQHQGAGTGKLEIRPQGTFEENAFYDKENGRLVFGYYQTAARTTGRYLPSTNAFTALSHDVIAHEVTHALLDGLRSNFITPTSPDTLAFHEGFADLIAVFHHFAYEEVVLAAMRNSHGHMEASTVLTSIATYFGHTTGSNGPLRSAIDTDPLKRAVYDPTIEIHKLGSVLVSAVFDAYTTIFNRKTEAYVLLATAGAGLRGGQLLPVGLAEILAHEASTVATQFLNVLIRAIDYCPPVDLEFGDFLRAVITADRELIADDKWSYREAWIDAFAARKIYPRTVDALSEDALVWNRPPHPLPPLLSLCFAELRFDGDPGNFLPQDEALRQARALGKFITEPQHLSSFGLVQNGDSRLQGDTVEPPSIESIRVAHRTGPDGQVLFDLVAEVVQKRMARLPDGSTFAYLGGCTIIFEPTGEVRYSIYKSVVGKERFTSWKDYVTGSLRHFWTKNQEQHLCPSTALFRTIHEMKPA